MAEQKGEAFEALEAIGKAVCITWHGTIPITVEKPAMECFRGEFETIRAALSHAEGEAVELDRYDAGVLGGTDDSPTCWWHDYIRSELDSAHDFYQQQVDGLTRPEPQRRAYTCDHQPDKETADRLGGAGAAFAAGCGGDDYEELGHYLLRTLAEEGFGVFELNTHPAPQVAGLTETAIKSSPAYRALHREKEHLLGLLKEQAPQVAVPEQRDDMIPEHFNVDECRGFRTGYNYLRDLLAAPTAPTAPAGELRPDCSVCGDFGSDCDVCGAPSQQPVSDPDGLPDRVLMPRALTAKNGAKTALMGEFTFSVTMTCPECHPDDPNPDCEVCSGSVEYEQPHTVPWTTIKRIYSAAVDLLSAPAPDEREIAAQALDDFMFDVAERVRLLSDSDQEARVLRKVNGWLHSRAARLRAGKEGEPS